MKFVKVLKANNIDIDKLIDDALYLFENDETADLMYDFMDHMGWKNMEDITNKDIIQAVKSDPEKAEKYIKVYIN